MLWGLGWEYWSNRNEVVLTQNPLHFSEGKVIVRSVLNLPNFLTEDNADASGKLLLKILNFNNFIWTCRLKCMIIYPLHSANPREIMVIVTEEGAQGINSYFLPTFSVAANLEILAISLKKSAYSVKKQASRPLLS